MVYVEKPIIFESTMIALMVEDATHTNTPTSQDPPLTTNNTTGKKVLQQPASDTHCSITPSPGTPCSIENRIEHPTDANNHHHDWWPVDLATIQCEFHHSCAIFCTFLETTFPPLQPAQKPSTPIANPTDDDNDKAADNESFQPCSHSQSVDLLTLQQEIIQQTLSIQAFFQSLALPNTDTICSNTILESNDHPTTAPTPDEPTTAAYPAPSYIKPSTLNKYLSHLHTEESFIPVCLLCQIALPNFHTQSYQPQFTLTTNTVTQQNLACKNICVPISQHLLVPTFLTPSTDTSTCKWWQWQHNSIILSNNQPATMTTASSCSISIGKCM